MKKLLFLLIGVFCAIVPSTIHAQRSLLEEEREIQKTVTLLGDDTSFSDIRCGEYFLFG